MAIHLSSPVSDLPGLGTKAVADLRLLDIRNVRDLLWYVPYRYDDYSRIVGAGEAKTGETITVIGVITSIKSRPARNRRLKIVEAVIEDSTGELKVVWFNQSYLEKTLPIGSKVSLAGRVDDRYGRSLVNPIIEKGETNTHTGRIVPVYGLTKSLTMKRLRNAMRASLPATKEFPDWMPSHIVEHERYPSLNDALQSIHFPDSKEDLNQAIARLKFDELFLHQLMFARVRVEGKKKQAHAIDLDKTFLTKFVSSLPFQLTDCQKKAIWEVVQDLSKSHPMNRLLEGDVGSGKTVVAAAAAGLVIHGGGKVVYLAPTEILARQQYESFSRFLSKPVALFTRTQQMFGGEVIKKSDLIHKLQSNEISCVVGTHTLLQDHINVKKFNLIIVDEQHRFGVEQRHALLDTGDNITPHLLSMSATPIPRTLALTVYGDLDLSILNTLPPGRKPVATAVVQRDQQDEMWKHVHEQIKKKQQVFVVCPLIDPSDKLGVKSVSEVVKMLQKKFNKRVHIELLHGRLKSDKKEEVIQDFRDGKIDILVSTTVVEVGVDIPNASIMVIMGAERFGLAQLHQLRGRVGRSDIQSYCYLLPEQLSGSSEARLRAMEETTNGFELAERDLELRGPGNVFGNAQSGFPDFQLATAADTDIMKKARDHATDVLAQDSDLDAYPLVRERIKQQFDRVHLE